jgi:hypothetical protein
MQAQLKVSPNVIVTAQGDTQADVFRQLAEMQEIFGQAKCGKCGCTELRFVVREVDGNSFYELRCTNKECRAVLTFGQNRDGAKKGNLFPHVRENTKGTIMGLTPGDWLPDGGWLRYNSETKRKY